MFGNANFDHVQMSAPLTSEQIKKLQNKTTYFGNEIVPGDKMFTFLLCSRDGGEVIKKAEIAVDSEIPLLECEFFMEENTDKIPTFWKDL